MGREFDALFDEWSRSYDQTVTGHDAEYEEVFSQYDKILDAVRDRATGFVVEFGPGTGNLTGKLLEKGLKIIGIEPSANMRKIAQKKHPDVKIIDGDFLNFHVQEKADTFASTYAFHHLTNEEKRAAISLFRTRLKAGGKIVFADTVFETEEAKQEMIREAKARGFCRLAEDLETEYYTTIPVLSSIFEENGFDVSFRKMNRFVWLMDAKMKGA
ncbi:class I SAM-dependent DNA methyltransferase [Heyndrickxia coagulans]|uniref:class I SAM-dependent DNA methyltransferase n=1 Tax=Heyndrickxia coagulans TaxID=1398 RepID=UPI0006287140|nr:class I SAM-dependent methyltransferase [Heyndrickxia coagulans]